MAWNSKVRLKHLFTENEDHESIQASMNAVADVVQRHPAFVLFSRAALDKMRNIPEGDDMFGPVDYANKLLDRLYDFADEWRIWIE